MEFVMVGKDYFGITFSSKEEKLKILKKGPWFMGGKGLSIYLWYPEFDPRKEIPSKIPIWVRLSFLLLHLWNLHTFALIGNCIGEFVIFLDQRDRNIITTYTRICVNINITEGLPEDLKLVVGDHLMIQQLNYEWVPFKCIRCRRYGHLVKDCLMLANIKGLEPQRNAQLGNQSGKQKKNSDEEGKIAWDLQAELSREEPQTGKVSHRELSSEDMILESESWEEAPGEEDPKLQTNPP
eukprot:Gb_38926 [translate_table: standard]